MSQKSTQTHSPNRGAVAKILQRETARAPKQFYLSICQLHIWESSGDVLETRVSLSKSFRCQNFKTYMVFANARHAFQELLHGDPGSAVWGKHTPLNHFHLHRRCHLPGIFRDDWPNGRRHPSSFEFLLHPSLTVFYNVLYTSFTGIHMLVQSTTSGYNLCNVLITIIATIFFSKKNNKPCLINPFWNEFNPV